MAELEERSSVRTEERDRLIGDKLSLETTSASLLATNSPLEVELHNLLTCIEAFERAERTSAEDLRSDAARLDSELRKSSALAEELDEMARSLDTLRKERDHAVQERDAVAPTIGKLTERIEAMQEYCTDQDVRLAQLQQSAAQVQDDGDDVNALHDEINVLNVHVEELEAEVADVNGQVEQMDKEWGRSLAELASTKRELERAERAGTRHGMTPPPTRPGSKGYEAHSRSASFARRPPSGLSSRTLFRLYTTLSHRTTSSKQFATSCAARTSLPGPSSGPSSAPQSTHLLTRRSTPPSVRRWTRHCARPSTQRWATFCLQSGTRSVMPLARRLETLRAKS